LDFNNGASDINIINTNGNVKFSDYYLEDATFLRCENIVLGYRMSKVLKGANIRLFSSVSNPFIITNYSGQDPENFNGIDNNFYPRPRTYTLGVNVDF
jgi:iron complex outermembrane receptor protein